MNFCCLIWRGVARAGMGLKLADQVVLSPEVGLLDLWDRGIPEERANLVQVVLLEAPEERRFGHPDLVDWDVSVPSRCLIVRCAEYAHLVRHEAAVRAAERRAPNFLDNPLVSLHDRIHFGIAIPSCHQCLLVVVIEKNII